MRRTYEDSETGAIVEVERDALEPGIRWISRVQCPARRAGEGGASRCLERAVRDADREGRILRLWVCPKPDTPVRRRLLREWYRGFGFAGNDYMVRPPRAAE